MTKTESEILIALIDGLTTTTLSQFDKEKFIKEKNIQLLKTTIRNMVGKEGKDKYDNN